MNNTHCTCSKHITHLEDLCDICKIEYQNWLESDNEVNKFSQIHKRLIYSVIATLNKIRTDIISFYKLSYIRKNK
jgi:hypothetical protein